MSPLIWVTKTSKASFQRWKWKPNPQCSNAACLERKKDYIRAEPARDAAARAEMEAEELLEPEGLHEDSEWNISVDDSGVQGSASNSEGLVHELPSADEFQTQPASQETTDTVTDLEDLRRQLEALNHS